MAHNEDSNEIHLLFRTLAKKVTEQWNIQNDNILSLTQFRMLYILNQHGRKKVAEIADFLQVTSGAITGMTDKLIKLGLVERKRDEEDRRIVYLYITDEGKVLVEKLIKNQTDFYARVIEQMNIEDVDHLKRILNQLIDIVDDVKNE